MVHDAFLKLEQARVAIVVAAVVENAVGSVRLRDAMHRSVVIDPIDVSRVHRDPEGDACFGETRRDVRGTAAQRTRPDATADASVGGRGPVDVLRVHGDPAGIGLRGNVDDLSGGAPGKGAALYGAVAGTPLVAPLGPVDAVGVAGQHERM